MIHNQLFYRVSLDKTFVKKPIPHKLLQMLLVPQQEVSYSLHYSNVGLRKAAALTPSRNTKLCGEVFAEAQKGKIASTKSGY